MDLNSIGNLLNTTTFPITLVIILLLGGYKLFNKHIAPLITSCIESNNKLVLALEKIENNIGNITERIGKVENDVNEIKQDIRR